MRSPVLLSSLLCLLVGLFGFVPAPSPVGAADGPSLRPFRGLGTWVDGYDYGPEFQGNPGALPAITVASVDDMAKLGIKTLYLQAAQDDTRSDGFIADQRLVARMLRRARQKGMKVFAWYLPPFGAVGGDPRHVRALYEFRSGGQKFDGLALDIEWTSDVKDTGKRNDALLELSRRTRSLVTSMPLGAIVLEPVLLEDVNQNYWPNFPWKKLADDFDVWMPMTYWTNRSSDSGWKDSFRYTNENIRRVRRNLDDLSAAVHPIGGIADQVTPGDLKGFTDAAKLRRSIGRSLYDYGTTSSSAWPRLRN